VVRRICDLAADGLPVAAALCGGRDCRGGGESRRPQQSPTQTARELEECVVELRQQRPDGGARKLQVLLADEGIHLPVIRVHRILLRRGLVRAQDRFRATVGRFERGAANRKGKWSAFRER